MNLNGLSPTACRLCRLAAVRSRARWQVPAGVRSFVCTLSDDCERKRGDQERGGYGYVERSGRDHAQRAQPHADPEPSVQRWCGLTSCEGECGCGQQSHVVVEDVGARQEGGQQKYRVVVAPRCVRVPIGPPRDRDGSEGHG